MSAKSVSKPSAVSLLLVASLSLASPTLLWAADDADGYVVSARDYFRTGKTEEALIELKNALQGAPEHVGARLLLAEVYLDLGQARAAEQELERVQRLAVPKQQWELLLGKTLLQLGKHERLLKELDLTSREEENLDDGYVATIHALRGSALLGKRDVAAGSKAFQQALKLDARQEMARKGEVRVLLLQGKRKAVEERLDTLLAENGRDPELWTLKGQLHNFHGESAQAIEAFNKALTNRPAYPQALLGRAKSYMTTNDLDAAMDDVERVRDKFPYLPYANYLRGNIHYQRKEWSDAEAALSMVLRLQGEHLGAHLLMGATTYQAGNYQTAAAHLGRYLERVPGHPPANKLMAAVYIKLRRLEDARKILDKAIKASPKDPQLLALQGSVLMQLGESEEGMKRLQAAAAKAPDTSSIRTQLALGMLASGDAKGAVGELETAVELGQGLIQADVMLVLSHLRSKDHKKALVAARAFARRQSDAAIPHNLLGVVHMAMGEEQQARAEFEQALKKDPKFSTSQMNLAQLDIRSGKPDEALLRYQQILGHTPNDLRAHMGMANAYIKKGEPTKGLEHVEKAWATNNGSIDPGLILMTHYLGRNEKEQATAIVRDLLGEHANNPAALKVVGETLLKAQAGDLAKEAFHRLLLLQPQSAGPRQLLAAALVLEGEKTAAIAELRKALDHNPDHLPSLVGLARLNLDAGKYDDVARASSAIKRQYPKRAVGYRIDGDLYRKQKQYERAARRYAKAYSLEPSGDLAIRRAGVLALAGKHQDAVTALKAWLKKTPGDLTVHSRLAGLLHSLKRYPQAIVHYEKVLEAAPNNVVVLNNLSWLYLKQKDERALSLAQRAVQHAPQSPEVIDTLGWVLLHQGDKQKAMRYLKQAALMAPKIPDIRYHLAAGFAQTGDKEAAQLELTRLLAAHREFEERPAALKLKAELGDQ